MKADGLLLNSSNYTDKEGQVKFKYSILVGDIQSNGAITGANVATIVCDTDKLIGTQYMGQLTVILELTSFYDQQSKSMVTKPKYNDVISLTNK